MMRYLVLLELTMHSHQKLLYQIVLLATLENIAQNSASQQSKEIVQLDTIVRVDLPQKCHRWEPHTAHALKATTVVQEQSLLLLALLEHTQQPFSCKQELIASHVQQAHTAMSLVSALQQDHALKATTVHSAQLQTQLSSALPSTTVLVDRLILIFAQSDFTSQEQETVIVFLVLQDRLALAAQ